jgi:PleD family two-component response regulator
MSDQQQGTRVDVAGAESAPATGSNLGLSVPGPTGWNDALTGLSGPEFFDRIVASAIAESIRYDRPLTVAVLELVGLEGLSAAWGPEVARRGVRQTAAAIARRTRSSDHLARIGPARFGVLFTETDEIAAINVVERIREDGVVGLPPGAEVGLVAGWASPRPGDPPEATLARASERLEADRRR